MDKRKTERILREKLEQIPVPDLPCPNLKAADTDTFLAPVPRPQRGFWRLPITAAVAAALLLCTTAALLQVSWPNLLAGPSPSLSPSVLPADSVPGTPVTKLPSSSPTVLLKERLARHLAAVIPDVRPDQITVSDKGQPCWGISSPRTRCSSPICVPIIPATRRYSIFLSLSGRAASSYRPLPMAPAFPSGRFGWGT